MTRGVLSHLSITRCPLPPSVNLPISSCSSLWCRKSKGCSVTDALVFATGLLVLLVIHWVVRGRERDNGDLSDVRTLGRCNSDGDGQGLRPNAKRAAHRFLPLTCVSGGSGANPRAPAPILPFTLLSIDTSPSTPCLHFKPPVSSGHEEPSMGSMTMIGWWKVGGREEDS